ncbi:MAG TPA: type II secretion system protein [Acidimicrobiia bacterium]|nr:type II secretion system protein [Acidimicrobiia bacterium]
MTLIELIVALSVLSVVMAGLGLTVASGFQTVALSRQRQVAEAAANKRLEEWRDVDYDQLALGSNPVHSTDPSYPDFYVSTDGSSFDCNCDGGYEPLIVDTVTPGPVPHVESPVQVGTTVVDVYNYVTWVDDRTIAGTQDLKRVTVMVRYRTLGRPGTARILRESVLFTPGTVIINGTSTTTSSSTSTTLPSSTTTTTTPAPCGSFSVAGSSSATSVYTATQSITLSMAFNGGCGDLIANFSNDDVTFGVDVPYDSSDPTVGWTFSSGDGNKTIYGKLRNTVGGFWTLNPQSIILDTVKPTTPGTLTRTVSCSGNTRTTALSWGVATDTNFVGYRLYRSTDGTTWQVIPPTLSGTSTSDSTSKSLASVRYYIAAYDKAGNESAPTNTITIAKNQCS